MIYLDNAATTSICDVGLGLLTKWNCEYGNSESPYRIGIESSNIIEQTRKSIADAIGSKNPNHIIFTSGGCEGNSAAIKSMALELFKKNTPIVIAISGLEHHSVINSVKWAENFLGAKIIYLPLKNGSIDVETVISQQIFQINKVNMLSVIWGNNETGAVQNNIITLLYEAQRNKVKVLVDAVQIIPHFGLDILKHIKDPLNCADFITFSGHKIGAPKGIGVLYCKDTSSFIPLIEGGEQENGKRGGTLNTGLIAALGGAVQHLQDNSLMLTYRNYTTFFNLINEELVKPYKLCFNNPAIFKDNALDKYMGIINIDCKTETNSIVTFLSENDIFVSTGSACNGTVNHSHVLERMGLNPETSLRISLSPSTTREEIERFIEKMKEYLDLINNLRC